MSPDMKTFATTTLWITSFVLPYLIFAAGHASRLRWGAVLGAGLAIGAGWAFVVAYAVSANAMALVSAGTDAERHAIFSGDGAALAFAATFGWLQPTVLVGLAWMVHRWALPGGGS